MKDPFLDQPFSVVAYLMILAVSVMMGTEIEPLVIWSKLKRPVGILIGFFSQYFFMSLVLFIPLSFRCILHCTFH